MKRCTQDWTYLSITTEISCHKSKQTHHLPHIMSFNTKFMIYSYLVFFIFFILFIIRHTKPYFRHFTFLFFLFKSITSFTLIRSFTLSGFTFIRISGEKVKKVNWGMKSKFLLEVWPTIWTRIPSRYSQMFPPFMSTIPKWQKCDKWGFPDFFPHSW